MRKIYLIFIFLFNFSPAFSGDNLREIEEMLYNSVKGKNYELVLKLLEEKKCYSLLIKPYFWHEPLITYILDDYFFSDDLSSDQNFLKVIKILKRYLNQSKVLDVFDMEDKDNRVIKKISYYNHDGDNKNIIDFCKDFDNKYYFTTSTNENPKKSTIPVPSREWENLLIKVKNIKDKPKDKLLDQISIDFLNYHIKSYLIKNEIYIENAQEIYLFHTLLNLGKLKDLHSLFLKNKELYSSIIDELVESDFAFLAPTLSVISLIQLYFLKNGESPTDFIFKSLNTAILLNNLELFDQLVIFLIKINSMNLILNLKKFPEFSFLKFIAQNRFKLILAISHHNPKEFSKNLSHIAYCLFCKFDKIKSSTDRIKFIENHNNLLEEIQNPENLIDIFNSNVLHCALKNNMHDEILQILNIYLFDIDKISYDPDLRSYDLDLKYNENTEEKLVAAFETMKIIRQKLTATNFLKFTGISTKYHYFPSFFVDYLNINKLDKFIESMELFYPKELYQDRNEVLENVLLDHFNHINIFEYFPSQLIILKDSNLFLEGKLKKIALKLFGLAIDNLEEDGEDFYLDDLNKDKEATKKFLEWVLPICSNDDFDKFFDEITAGKNFDEETFGEFYELILQRKENKLDSIN